MKKTRNNLMPAERFFFEHAGFSYDPKKETKHAGRIRCAVEMAEAERFASNLGLSFDWSDDYHDDGFKDYTPETCESCTCWDATGMHVLASLGCIDDASPEYRRVIQAELALEAVAKYDRETETIDAH